MHKLCNILFSYLLYLAFICTLYKQNITLKNLVSIDLICKIYSLVFREDYILEANRWPAKSSSSDLEA